MARRQKEARRAGIASRGIVRRLSHFSSRVRHRDIPDARGCLISATPRGSVVDVCSDAPARAQRLSTRRMAVLWTLRGPFSVSPRAPRIKASITVSATFSSPVYATARFGGLRGAGGMSTASKIAANIDRGFCPKNRSAAVVPSARVRKKLCIAVRQARFL